MNDNDAIRLKCATAAETEQAGRKASPGLRPGQLIFLRGDLGAGKTTWVRGLLRGLRYSGAVKSPTYTLVETYEFDSCNVYHFDLYRLNDPSELEALAFRDYLDGSGVCLVEWPERGVELLPEPDCLIDIEYDNSSRCLSMNCTTTLGRSLCDGVH